MEPVNTPLWRSPSIIAGVSHPVPPSPAASAWGYDETQMVSPSSSPPSKRPHLMMSAYAFHSGSPQRLRRSSATIPSASSTPSPPAAPGARPLPRVVRLGTLSPAPVGEALRPVSGQELSAAPERLLSVWQTLCGQAPPAGGGEAAEHTQ